MACLDFAGHMPCIHHPLKLRSSFRQASAGLPAGTGYYPHLVVFVRSEEVRYPDGFSGAERHAKSV